MVPSEVARDKNLSGAHKMLFGAINSLCKAAEGRCIASNTMLATTTGQSVSNVELGLSVLKRRRLINVVMAKRGVRDHIMVAWCPTRTLGRDKIVINKISIPNGMYYGSKNDGRSRHDVSSQSKSPPKQRRNRLNIVGTRELDRRILEECEIQGKMPPQNAPPKAPRAPWYSAKPPLTNTRGTSTGAPGGLTAVV